MIDLDPVVQAALEARALRARDFLWFTVRDRATGDLYSEGYWSGRDDVSVTMPDPVTGATETRLYRAQPAISGVGGIPRVSGTAVQSVTLRLSQVAPRINDLLRGYDPRQGRVQIHRGLFDPQTGALVATPITRFLAWNDQVRIQTPPEGEVGAVDVTCVSDARELTRSNPDTRSDASQRVRNATDAFFKDVATAGELQVFWGQASQ